MQIINAKNLAILIFCIGVFGITICDSLTDETIRSITKNHGNIYACIVAIAINLLFLRHHSTISKKTKGLSEAIILLKLSVFSYGMLLCSYIFLALCRIDHIQNMSMARVIIFAYFMSLSFSGILGYLK